MRTLLDRVNPGLKSRVSDIIDFPDFKATDAAAIAANLLKRKRLGRVGTDILVEELRSLLGHRTGRTAATSTRGSGGLPSSARQRVFCSDARFCTSRDPRFVGAEARRRSCGCAARPARRFHDRGHDHRAAAGPKVAWRTCARRRRMMMMMTIPSARRI